ncbi:MAG TPA: hypothetical protein VFJ65_03250, partial [Solirubrobacterales bacterium]|nr:hypothetical protein [Solirubrobacterales bacterium]
HGRMSHGQSLYQEVVQVPLLFAAPHRIPAGRRLGPASLLDVVPTLADLLGLHLPAGSLDGVSLAGPLTAARPQPVPGRGFLLHLDFEDGTGLALLYGHDKLVLGQRPYRKELFDLAADPGEQRNRLGGPGAAAVVARLGSEMARLYERYTDAALARRAVPIGDELMRKLGALGYVAGRARPDERRIPERISAPDPYPNGLLGWEGAALTTCVRLAERGSEAYLLDGWYGVEAGGRWTAPYGSLALAPPTGGLPSALVLQGANFRPAAVRLRVSVDRRPLIDAALPPGGFRLAAPLRRSLARPLLVEIAADPAFVPSPSGAGDNRSLGIFLATACVLPAAEGGDRYRVGGP